ncbi:FYB1 protein, partial [Serilophus lunatus]|nr:FYB1 protein [Serilophus lunatus]
MEKLSAGDRDTEDVSAQHQPFKIPRKEIPEGLQQERKASLERIASQGKADRSSGPSTARGTLHPKPPLGVKPSTYDKTEHDPKPSHLNPVAQKFGVHLQATNKGNYGKTECTQFLNETSDLAKEDPKPLHPKPAQYKAHNSAPPDEKKNPLGSKPNSDFASQEIEGKPAISKVAGIKEKLMSAAQKDEPKSFLSKQPVAQKQPLKDEISHNKDTSNKCRLQSRLLGSKINIPPFKEGKEMDENNPAAEATGSHFLNKAPKPTHHQHSFYRGSSKNVEEKTKEEEMSVAKTTIVKKIPQEGSDSSSCKLRKTNTVLGAGRSSDKDEEKSSRIPRRTVMAPVFKVPLSPPKPNRPPNVDLKLILKSNPKPRPKAENSQQPRPASSAFAQPAGPSHSATQLPPPPPASHPSVQAPAAPNPPPRNIKPRSETVSPENEENYDDVEFVSQGHGNTQGDQESDVEMYEDINDMRSSRGKEKKWNKEDKRRMEQEKKEQKEKEKKDQELKKKFKLVTPIEVLHHARACVDYKGGKNELTVKQGDKIEIIRLTDNPEGKWLGRIGGCYGYIKTTMVEIDYDSLKRKQQPSTSAAVKFLESDQEMYDDVGDQDNIISLFLKCYVTNQCSFFITCPDEEKHKSQHSNKRSAYGSVSQDEDKDGIWSWGILKRLKVKDDKKKSIREKTTKVNGAEDNGNLLMSSSTKLSGKDFGEDVYDDVDSSDFPLPPPDPRQEKILSLGKLKSDEKDVQKLKKMEREEKEFRKNFKFVGEIKVLYSTTVKNFPQKRCGYKCLQIIPGESLDIIENTDDTKVLCRNEDGK